MRFMAAVQCEAHAIYIYIFVGCYLESVCIIFSPNWLIQGLGFSFVVVYYISLIGVVFILLEAFLPISLKSYCLVQR